MHEELYQALNAYLDGELSGMRLRQMQTHLESCSTCRNELKELRRVSELLQAAPEPNCLPLERFISNLALSLPRRNIQEQPAKPGSLLWWLVPMILIGSWFFLQTTFRLTSLISAFNLAGFFEQAAVLFSSGDARSLWLLFLSLFSGSSALGLQASTLSLLDLVDGLTADLLASFTWQALIAGMYWAWLAGWWLLRRPRPMKMSNNPVHS